VTPARRIQDGPRTHALVIGVSAYQYLPRDGDSPPPGRETFGLTQLESAAASAWRFARWLTTRYNNPDAPLGGLWLRLSPSEREQEALAGQPGSEAPAATAEGVRAALLEWAESCATSPENVSILYAAGHGILQTKDEGGVVLLEDFAEHRLTALDNALDIGSVRAAFGRPEMAQRQIWFTDACRIRTKADQLFTMTAGVRLDGDRVHDADVSMAYSSAAPGARAYGRPGRSSLFADVLLDCLDRDAAHPDKAGRWVVTSDRLAAVLRLGVEERAERAKLDQRAHVGAFGDNAVIHVLDEPPEVDVDISVDPEDAGPNCVATLHNAYVTLLNRVAVPVKQPVRAGLWTVDVSVAEHEPRLYCDRTGVPCSAYPPAAEPTIVRVRDDHAPH
jgi:hypothetical protein